MIAPFNKTQNGLLEYRQHIPALSAKEAYAKLQPFVELEASGVRTDIGGQMYDRALSHYQTAGYLSAEPTKEEKDLDRLVYLIQSVIALFSFTHYSRSNDVIHSENGRRVHWSESSKPAEQWRIDDQEEANSRAAHKAMDILLGYLEEKREVFVEWLESKEREKLRTLVIQNAEQWTKVHPIGSSRWLHKRCYAFFFSYQVDHLQLVAGEFFEAVQEKRLANTALSLQEQTLLKRMQMCQGLYACMRAVLELPISILPEGIVQRYRGDRNSTRASQVADSYDRKSTAHHLKLQLKREELKLEHLVGQLSEITSQEPDSTIQSEDKFYMP
jgi:hypothetical protein